MTVYSIFDNTNNIGTGVIKGNVVNSKYSRIGTLTPTF